MWINNKDGQDRIEKEKEHFYNFKYLYYKIFMLKNVLIYMLS